MSLEYDQSAATARLTHAPDALRRLQPASVTTSQAPNVRQGTRSRQLKIVGGQVEGAPLPFLAAQSAPGCLSPPGP
jgi:hypothetical protein